MTLDPAGEQTVKNPATLTELSVDGLIADAKEFWTAIKTAYTHRG